MSTLSIKQRISQALEEFKCSKNGLAGGDPALSRRIQRQVNGNTRLSASTVELFLNAFPEVSAEWLLRGSGNMLLHEQVDSAHADMRDIIRRIDAIESRLSKDNILTKKIAK